MIKISNLKKSYPGGFTLNIPELTVQPGERVAVIGPNGSGKSTLLKLLSGIITPDSGAVEIQKGALIGYEPQNAYSFMGTVEKNIRLAASPKYDLNEILNRTLLYGLKDKKSAGLSGGEKQRMCLARMLAGDYRILLLDEPLSAADMEMAEELENYVIQVCEERRITLLMCTHLPSQAAHVATKILIMNNGTVSEYSDAAQLKNPKSEFGKRFTQQWRI